jgi:SAM-dependent methyltransferase
MKLLELGGGDQPLLHPNLDSRRLHLVDIVWDLDNPPYPVPDQAVDGILCKFAAEHISWKKVQAFCDELYRITRPGGVVVLITPNTLEQCKRIVQEGEFTQDTECMLFGGQGYPEDTHACAWSPKLAQDRLFRAGFYEVKTFPWPDAITDMIIQARKSCTEVQVG